MFNKVILVGYLTRDPELRYTSNDIAFGRFTVAVNRTYHNQDGEREADFINIVAWRKLAENCVNFTRKGSMVLIEGRIQTRNYENDEGQKRYVTEVVADNVRFLKSPNNQNSKLKTPTFDDPFGKFDDPFDLPEDKIPF